jgi:hypothetical protein
MYMYIAAAEFQPGILEQNQSVFESKILISSQYLLLQMKVAIRWRRQASRSKRRRYCEALFASIKYHRFTQFVDDRAVQSLMQKNIARWSIMARNDV